LDGRARQPLPLQRRLRRAHAQATQPDITVPSLLLTTTGRKPGEKFILPLCYGKTGDSCIVVASKGGALQHPGWYRNLVANPEVEVQVEAQKMKAGARTATGTHAAVARGAKVLAALRRIHYREGVVQMVDYQPIAELVKEIPADTWKILQEIQKRRPAMMLHELRDKRERAPKQPPNAEARKVVIAS